MTRIAARQYSIVSLAIVVAAATLGGRARAATVEAYAGEPFGVARITLPVGGSGPVAPLDDERFTVESPDGRALYPVLKEEPVRQMLRQLLEIDRPRNATVYFLFRGDEPFDAQAYAPTGQTIRVTPMSDPAGHARLLAEWWEQYVNRWKSLRQDPQFPPVVENFLAANLARRLGLTLPAPECGIAGEPQSAAKRHGTICWSPSVTNSPSTRSSSPAGQKRRILRAPQWRSSRCRRKCRGTTSPRQTPSSKPCPSSRSPPTCRLSAFTCASATSRTTSGSAISTKSGKAILAT